MQRPRRAVPMACYDSVARWISEGTEPMTKLTAGLIQMNLKGGLRNRLIVSASR